MKQGVTALQSKILSLQEKNNNIESNLKQEILDIGGKLKENSFCLNWLLMKENVFNANILSNNGSNYNDSALHVIKCWKSLYDFLQSDTKYQHSHGKNDIIFWTGERLGEYLK